MKDDITKLVEEHPDVKRLKDEIVQRTNRLHKEILALGLSLQNIQRFLKLYERFHLSVCDNNPRNYSHARFIEDFLAHGDLKEVGKKKSNEWLEWQLKNVELTLRRMGRYIEVVGKNRELQEEIIGLKAEIEELKKQIEWQAQVYGMQMDRSKYLNLERDSKVNFQILREEQQIEILCLPIDDLSNLSNRTRNILKHCDLSTIGDVIEIPREYLMRIYGIGIKSMEEIEYALKRFNLKLT